MEKQNRIEVVKAMDTIARCITNESIIDSWLSCGCPDCSTEDDYEWFAESDVQLKNLMSLFLRLMARAKVNGGIHVDGVVSEEYENKGKKYKKALEKFIIPMIEFISFCSEDKTINFLNASFDEVVDEYLECFK